MDKTLIILSFVLSFNSPKIVSALPAPEDIPEEILKTEIV
jgi:hypothetical protein